MFGWNSNKILLYLLFTSHGTIAWMSIADLVIMLEMNTRLDKTIVVKRNQK